MLHTGKHLCQSLFLIKIKKRLQHRYFLVKFAKVLRTPEDFTEHLQTTAFTHVDNFSSVSSSILRDQAHLWEKYPSRSTRQIRIGRLLVQTQLGACPGLQEPNLVTRHSVAFWSNNTTLQLTLDGSGFSLDIGPRLVMEKPRIEVHLH